MRDARQISSREVSQGVQRHVLTQTTWLGSTVVAHSGAVPLVFRTPQRDRISTYPSVHQAADLRHQARDSDEQRRPAGVRVGRDHAPSHGRSHHWFDVTANFICGG